jgi:hypothetical protein
MKQKSILLPVIALSALLALLLSSSLPVASAYNTNTPSISPPAFGTLPAAATVLSADTITGTTINAGSTVSAPFGVFTVADLKQINLATNSPASLPATPFTRGGCYFWNSNATLYVIMSSVNGNAWTKTNLVSAP